MEFVSNSRKRAVEGRSQWDSGPDSNWWVSYSELRNRHGKSSVFVAYTVYTNQHGGFSIAMFLQRSVVINKAILGKILESYLSHPWEFFFDSRLGVWDPKFCQVLFEVLHNPYPYFFTHRMWWMLGLQVPGWAANRTNKKPQLKRFNSAWCMSFTLKLAKVKAPKKMTFSISKMTYSISKMTYSISRSFFFWAMGALVSIGVLLFFMGYFLSSG